MEMPLADIIDRYTILKLKVERIGGLTPDQIINEKPFLEKEFNLYKQAIDEFRQKGINIREDLIKELYDINAKSWDMESDIRHGKEGLLGLEEVGRRAIMLRDFNKERIAVKNKIVEETGVGFREVKILNKINNS